MTQTTGLTRIKAMDDLFKDGKWVPIADIYEWECDEMNEELEKLREENKYLRQSHSELVEEKENAVKASLIFTEMWRHAEAECEKLKQESERRQTDYEMLKGDYNSLLADYRNLRQP